MADDKGDQVCKHTLCNCPVSKEDSYCSQRCEDSNEAGIETIGCECGHSGCAGELTA